MSEGRLGGDVPVPPGGTPIVVDIAENSSQREGGANVKCRFDGGGQWPWNMRHRSKHEMNCWIGQRIRQRRIALGLTQQALGRGLGVTWRHVQKYENGACSLSAARLYRLALFLGVPIDELFEEATAGGAPLSLETGQVDPPCSLFPPLSRRGAPLSLETGQVDPHANGPPSELECSEFLTAFRRINRFALRSAFSHLARAVAVRGNGETGD